MSNEDVGFSSDSGYSSDLNNSDNLGSTSESEETAESKDADIEELISGQESKEETTESLNCIVCYEKLDINNIVNTQCDHKYCWECFFKWIKQNPTCPYCRCEFLSEDIWYQRRDVNEDATNMRSLVNILQLDLIKSSRELFMVNKEKEKMICKTAKLKAERRLNLLSTITLSEQIEYMRGYLTALRGDNTEKIIVKRVRNTPWFRGFTYGIFEINQENNDIDYEKLNSFVNSHSKKGHAFKVSKKWENKDCLEDQKNFTFGKFNNKTSTGSSTRCDYEGAEAVEAKVVEAVEAVVVEEASVGAPTPPEMSMREEVQNATGRYNTTVVL